MCFACVDEDRGARLAHAERLQELRERQRGFERRRIEAIRLRGGRHERGREEITIDHRIVFTVVAGKERVEDLAPVLAVLLVRERGNGRKKTPRRGLTKVLVLVED